MTPICPVCGDMLDEHTAPDRVWCTRQLRRPAPDSDTGGNT